MSLSSHWIIGWKFPGYGKFYQPPHDKLTPNVSCQTVNSRVVLVGGRAGSESLSLCRGRDCVPVVPADLDPLFIASYLLRGGSYMFTSTVHAGTTPSISSTCWRVVPSCQLMMFYCHLFRDFLMSRLVVDNYTLPCRL